MQKKVYFIVTLCLTVVSIYSQNINIYEWGEKRIAKVSSMQEAHFLLDSLVNIGYYSLRIDSISQHNYYITKGKKYKLPILILDSLSQSLISREEKILGMDSLISRLQSKLESEGYTFSTIHKKFQNDSLFISIKTNPQRHIEGIVWNSDHRLPKGFIRVFESEYLGEVYNEATLVDIQKKLSQNKFLGPKKNTQVLFLKDSTLVYLYPEKLKKNYFDGILGFSNNETDALKLTGNIDLYLGNVLNALEEIELHWNSAVNASQDFNLGANFPYIGGTKIGSDTRLHIFRQDSTFVNINLGEELFYQLNAKTQLGCNGFLQSSTYLSSVDSLSLNDDFSKSAWGLSYRYRVRDPLPLFEDRFYTELRGNFIRQKVEGASSQSQYLIDAQLQYIYPVQAKHYLYSALRYYNLLSDTYVSNELLRQGGIYSFRGFNENSIISNQFIKGTLEYRFVPNEVIYFQLFSDLGSFENSVQNTRNFLMGFGAGFSFRTRFGLFSLQYALGKFPNEPISFGQSRIHIGLRALL